MACNAFNHPPDCNCDFRGGHKGSIPPRPAPPAPLFGDLAPAMSGRSFQTHPRPCPRCGQPTFFVRASNGGSYRAAADGSKLRHNCPRQVPPRPLRLKRPSSRKGWFSATVEEMKGRGLKAGQTLRVTSLVEGHPFRVRLLDGLRIDTGAPVMCRWSPQDPRVLEIAYVDNDTGEFTETRVSGRRLRG